MPTIRHDLIRKQVYLCPLGKTCPRGDTCIRALLYESHSQPNTIIECISPSSKPHECRHYVPNEPVHLACGFSSILQRCRADQKRGVRWSVMKALRVCERNAYKYIRGDYPLQPSQRERIEAVFEQYGLEPIFDTWVEAYQDL